MTTTVARSSSGELAPSRLHPGDILRVGSIGLRTRRLRASLSALGIAIGIAAMVAVLGISQSSKAHLLSSLDKLGTNLLTVQASSGFGIGRNTNTALPTSAEPMIGRIGPVQVVSSETNVNAAVLRTDKVPSTETSAITVMAVDPALLSTLKGTLQTGRFIDAVNSHFPVTVLGAVAAQRLDVTQAGTRVWLGGQWFEVIGILQPITLAQDVDRAALIGQPIAQSQFAASSSADTIYLRSKLSQLDNVRDVIPATANPENPDQVQVSRPSDAIAARAAASSAFTALFLGLGGVALLVGGVGIANVMVISVLERRSEIGLRRALGATKRHVSQQFLSEALFLSFLGGVGGATIGALVTIGYDVARGWPIVVPWIAPVGGVLAALAIGAIAGLYPAMRAARLAPTEALRTA